MLSNTTERKDRTTPVGNWYPDAVISERITPAVVAHYMARARRLRCQATAELAGKMVTAVASGFLTLLWPMAFQEEGDETRKS